jgi:hypothetical protein
MIGKIEKARQYAEQPERIQITELKANFRGTNGDYVVTLKDGQWHCNSSSFKSWGTSSHIMALQQLLDSMLVPEARQPATTSGVHMHSDMIGKIEKARRYAQEPERIQITELKANFRGSNSDHLVTLQDGQWHCDTPFFRNWGTSSHIMAMQRVLDRMLAPEARQPAMATVNTPHETASL